MRCPFCGRELERGFLQSGRTAFFTTKRRRFLFWPDEQNGDVELTQHNWTSPIAPAWICRSCRKVVIDCEETL